MSVKHSYVDQFNLFWPRWALSLLWCEPILHTIIEPEWSQNIKSCCNLHEMLGRPGWLSQSQNCSGFGDVFCLKQLYCYKYICYMVDEIECQKPCHYNSRFGDKAVHFLSNIFFHYICISWCIPALRFWLNEQEVTKRWTICAISKELNHQWRSPYKQTLHQTPEMGLFISESMFTIRYLFGQAMIK